MTAQCPPPKALSVLALEDPRILGAHNAGVAAIAEEMERLAGARIRKLGANDTRNTSNLVISRWDHTASRVLDPQIHTHLVAANLTYDGVERIWKALDATEMYQQTGYLTEVYRNAVAQVLNSLGYQVVDRFEQAKTTVSASSRYRKRRSKSSRAGQRRRKPPLPNLSGRMADNRRKMKYPRWYAKLATRN